MSDARAATDDLAESLMLLKREFRGRDYATCQAMLHVDREVGRMAARIRELEAALCACADDLEAELNNRYPPAIRKYPCMEIDYQRDMHSVHEARAMLAAAPRP